MTKTQLAQDLRRILDSKGIPNRTWLDRDVIRAFVVCSRCWKIADDEDEIEEKIQASVDAEDFVRRCKHGCR